MMTIAITIREGCLGTLTGTVRHEHDLLNNTHHVLVDPTRFVTPAQARKTVLAEVGKALSMQGFIYEEKDNG